MSALFSPYTLRNLTLPNRIVISPMCQYSAVNGEPQAWHMIHLGSMALSGAGMLCLEATAVEPEGRIGPNDLGLWDDKTEASFKPVLDAIRKHSKIAVAMQISHAGRKASCDLPWQGGKQLSLDQGGWNTVSPSAIPMNEGERPPTELDKPAMERLIKAFAETAKRADRLGFDAVEVHAAHGYLIHQFLSPISNKRTDEYGGSLENRMRFPLAVFDAVRAAFSKDKPVGVRISATDWIEDGWDLEQSIVFAKELKKRGVDWMDVSSGGISLAQKITLKPAYQTPFAEAIKKETGLPTFAVGLITEYKQAEEIIANGQADFIALARAMLYDARWPWHAAAELGASVNVPPQYLRCQPREYKNLFS
jgi:2,4-dienoyl-CoA reductase-like NADH-dependent reductase (Old Yellow Enzyme family)